MSRVHTSYGDPVAFLAWVAGVWRLEYFVLAGKTLGLDPRKDNGSVKAATAASIPLTTGRDERGVMF
jgi:hypothetical protein